jgi:OPA family sugar phosphate sensor protein UhpC-like MFS transporter
MKAYVRELLKPAPYLDEIQDEDLVKKKYRMWRLRTFYAMYIGYAFYYFTRKSFTFAMPAMQLHLGLSKFELGLLASILSISYGASKFVSGILGDKSNPRYFMSAGLILTGIFNILFGLSSSWWAFAIFWGLNGWFQGWGWPGCAKLLTHWYSHTERGRWWSLWNTSHNLGGYLIPLIAAFAIQTFGWRYAMHVPGILCIFVGFFLINRLRDTPQSLGLPPIEKFRNDFSTADRETTELSSKEILWKYVLNNKYVWILAFASFFIYIIRTALNDWVMMYLLEVRGYTPLVAGTCVCWFEAGGFLGSLAAGWSSDLLFRGKRMPINILFTLGVLAVIISFKSLPIHSPILDSTYIFLFGFFIFGPQMLLGMACAELSHNKAAATSTGFAGCFAYLGAAVAGGPLGALTNRWGWEGFFYALIVCTIIPLLFMLPLWSVTKKCEEI